VVAFAVLASLATTGCEDNVDWLLDVAGAAGGSSPGGLADAGSSNTSLSPNGSGGYQGSVTHSDGTILGTYGDTTSTFNVPGNRPGGSLLAHGPVMSSPVFPTGGTGYQGGPTYQGGPVYQGGPTYQGGSGYQGRPTYQSGTGYHGPAYNGGPPVSVNLSPVPPGRPTTPNSGTRPPVFPQALTGQPTTPTPVETTEIAAVPNSDPDPFKTGESSPNPFATVAPTNVAGAAGTPAVETPAVETPAVETPQAQDPADWSFGGDGTEYVPPANLESQTDLIDSVAVNDPPALGGAGSGGSSLMPMNDSLMMDSPSNMLMS
jgi:hypothetical protein